MLLRRSLLVAALAAPLLPAACGPDPFPPEYLGVVDGGTRFEPPDAGPPHVKSDAGGLPPAADGGVATCPSPSPFQVATPAASAVGGLATASDRVALSLGGRGYAFAPQDGCAGAAVAGPFGDALGAIGYGAGQTWATSGSAVLALSQAGKVLATCATSASALAVDPSTGAAYAIDGAKLRVLVLTGTTCAVTEVALPSTATAIAASSQPGSVWLATLASDASIGIARYDVATGAPISGGASFAAPACAATALAEVGDRLAVADASCSRVWSFQLADGALAGSTTSTPGFWPTAIAAAPGTTGRALVTETSATGATSAVVQLSLVNLP